MHYCADCEQLLCASCGPPARREAAQQVLKPDAKLEHYLSHIRVDPALSGYDHGKMELARRVYGFTFSTRSGRPDTT